MIFCFLTIFFFQRNAREDNFVEYSHAQISASVDRCYP